MKLVLKGAIVICILGSLYFASRRVFVGDAGSSPRSGKVGSFHLRPEPGDINKRRHDHKRSLVLGVDGRLVDLEVFEEKLPVDASFDKTSPTYKSSVLTSFLSIAFEVDPQQALKFLKDNPALWSNDTHATQDVMLSVAKAVGIANIGEYLDMVGSEKLKQVCIQQLTVFSNQLGSGEVLDFLLKYDPSVFSEDTIVRNILVSTQGGFEAVLQNYLKVPVNCRIGDGSAILAEELLSLDSENASETYQRAISELSAAEIATLDESLLAGLNLDNPLFGAILSKGFVGDVSNLARAAQASADVDLEKAVSTVNSLDSLTTEQKSSLMSGIVRSWSQFNPAEAASYAYGGLTSGETNDAPLRTVYSEWIARDTAAAESYFRKLDLPASAFIGLDLENFRNVANISVSKAVDVINQRSENPAYPEGFLENMVADLAASTAVEQSPATVIEKLKTIQDEGYRELGFHRIISRTSDRDIELAISIVASESSPSDRDAMIGGLLGNAISYDPTYALDIISNIHNIGSRAEGYRSWYDYMKFFSPHEASAWINELRNTNPELHKLISE